MHNAQVGIVGAGPGIFHSAIVAQIQLTWQFLYATGSNELGEHHKKVNQELNLFGHPAYLTHL